jgi:dTDP-4-dehydrorhamnose reductase
LFYFVRRYLACSCAQDPDRSHAVNVESTQRVIDQLQEWLVPFTFMSSGSVFDGTRPNSSEADPANPIMLYGQQKLDIEHYLEKSEKPFSIARLGKVFGSTSANEKLFTGWISPVENGDTVIRCATGQVF